jgi:hypothetical protein
MSLQKKEDKNLILMGVVCVKADDEGPRIIPLTVYFALTAF